MSLGTFETTCKTTRYTCAFYFTRQPGADIVAWMPFSLICLCLHYMNEILVLFPEFS